MIEASQERSGEVDGQSLSHARDRVLDATGGRLRGPPLSGTQRPENPLFPIVRDLERPVDASLTPPRHLGRPAGAADPPPRWRSAALPRGASPGRSSSLPPRARF